MVEVNYQLGYTYSTTIVNCCPKLSIFLKQTNFAHVLIGKFSRNSGQKSMMKSMLCTHIIIQPVFVSFSPTYMTCIMHNPSRWVDDQAYPAKFINKLWMIQTFKLIIITSFWNWLNNDSYYDNVIERIENLKDCQINTTFKDHPILPDITETDCLWLAWSTFG